MFCQRYQSNDNNQKQDGHDSFVSEYSAHAQRRSFDDDDHTIIKESILQSQHVEMIRIWFFILHVAYLKVIE